jgi:hypothetical protein
MDVGGGEVRRAGGWRGGVGVKKSSGGVAVSEVLGLGLGADGAGRLVADGGRGLRLRKTFQNH